MPGLHTAQGAAAAVGGWAAPPTRLVVVDDPQRLTRETLVAAISAVPGLAAIDAAQASPTAVDRADAAVLAARSLRLGSRGPLAAPLRSRSRRPVVVIADNGPVAPCGDARGLIVVSRDTPLPIIIGCLQPDGPDPADLPRWQEAVRDGGAALTPRERQVLGLLASGLSPAEVARGLAITTYTARDHIKAIRQKLDRPTIMAAVLEAIRRGVLQLDRV